MSDVKRTRYFIRNPQSGEPWAYCGELQPWESLAALVGGFVAGEIESDFGGADGVSDTFTIEVKRQEMTDAEVAALPEM